MGLKWKSWKYKLKRKSYDPSLTITEIVDAQSDHGVDKIQFKKLVTSWFSEDTQAESEKNKKICLKSNEPRVTRTKSFARLIDEETKKNGVRPSRAMVYHICRTRKDRSIVNASAAEVMDKLQEISDASNGGSTEPGGVMDRTNDDLAKVKGREKGGRIRCLGKVVKAKRHGSHSQQDQVPILKARINELEDEMKEKRAVEAKEMKELRERQELKLRFMSVVKEQLPNANFSNVFNGLNVECL